jgi:hypothetical protein
VRATDNAGEANLTYTWAATIVPAGAPMPTFTVNGTNAAKATTVNFAARGAYQFTVTVADAGGLSVRSLVNVLVQSTLKEIRVIPVTATPSPGSTQKLTAIGRNQFGQAITLPKIVWSTTGGKITSSGVFTAPTTPGTYSITATSGAVRGRATLQVNLPITPPQVAVPARSTSGPAVTTRATSLSVLGAYSTGEKSLTYTWATITKPTGAADPSFSINGSNAAKTTSVSFSQSGDYSFLVTIADTSGKSVTSTVTVHVGQTLCQIVVSPQVATVNAHGTQQFTAAALDQFGRPMVTTPALTWSTTAGTISPAGLYTAPDAQAVATVTAVAGTVTASAIATTPNASPHVVTPAHTDTNPAKGTTATLAVLANDDGGEANLRYTWALTAAPLGAPAPTFSSNGTNAAKTTTVRFAQAGAYTFTVTVADMNGLTVSSAVTVQVSQSLTTLAVSPASAIVNAGATQMFTTTACDQFGRPMVTTPALTWSTTAGTISPAGLYTAPDAQAVATVTAVAGTVTASAIATTPNWLAVNIGSSGVSGTVSTNNGTVLMTSNGIGETGSGDNLTYYYFSLLTQDIDIRARITSLTGVANTSSMGIMLRSSNDPNATVAAGCVYPTNSGSPEAVEWSHEIGGWNGWNTTFTMPMWLRLVRVGNDFAVYKSQDGELWTQVADASGGAFKDDGTFEAGLYVASGDPSQRASATFDSFSASPPHLPYSSSWIGNTYAQDSTGYVSNNSSAMWVSPNGTVYTNSPYDEGGESTKMYKDGTVLGPIMLYTYQSMGNTSAYEGSITGDGTHVYLAAQDQIYQTNMSADGTATYPLNFLTNLWDDAKSTNVTSGMVVAGDLLFVSDERDQKILVAQTDVPRYYRMLGSTVSRTDTTIDTTGMANAAPEEVYQSQRVCSSLDYAFFGFRPGSTYQLRFHFAEYQYDEPGKRLMDIYTTAGNLSTYDIVAQAGGGDKAAVLDIPPATVGASGVVSFDIVPSASSPDRSVVLCGVEILDSQGNQLLAVNVGGPTIAGFQGETAELPAREFSFQRPGPMVVDKRGDLWIIQEANNFPIVQKGPYPAYSGAILCYNQDGTYTGRSIAIANPTALAYDAANDTLLVADNGPDQNIKIIGNLQDAPVVTGSIGVPGGIYAGANPGQLYDAQSGGWERFYGLTGVGIDAQGNVYVSCSSSGGNGTDLRKFAPDGSLVWKVAGLPFCNTADFDPDSDGTELYGTFTQYTMDYSQTAPGSQWSYTANTWDPLTYGTPDRMGSAQAIVRRVGPQRSLVLYTSGQGTIDYIGIFRYQGLTAIPCGWIRPENGKLMVWSDLNGDGVATPDEITTADTGYNVGPFYSFTVDSKGNIWVVDADQASAGLFCLREFFFQGLSPQGVPLYGANQGDYEDMPFPATGFSASAWGQTSHVYYDDNNDVMYIVGPANSRLNGQDILLPQNYLARYDHWSSGNRTATWITLLPSPETDPNFAYSQPYPYDLGFWWTGFDVAGDKLFLAEIWGPIHVFDAATGKQETILNAGPEISGRLAWEDATMGVHAFQRSDGEYIVVSENSGWHARMNMWRYTPTF